MCCALRSLLVGGLVLLAASCAVVRLLQCLQLTLPCRVARVLQAQRVALSLHVSLGHAGGWWDGFAVKSY